MDEAGGCGIVLSVVGVWGRRPDGVEIGAVPFGYLHPVSSLRGRWHVQVRNGPGREAIVLLGPVSEREARDEARRLWVEYRVGEE